VKIAVIPARGGSKRIPHKNIRDFCGKPIIAYSIEQASNSGLFDRVIVSTDDEEIALVARKYGAETPFIRPSDISDDFTGTNAVVKHAIEWFQQQGRTIEFACCIYATAPFVQARYLQEGYEKLVKSNRAFAFSVTSYAFPIQRAIRINTQGKVEAIWPENINTRSQDLEDTFHDAGQFYWGTSAAFLQDQVIFSTESIPVIVPRFLVQDIDTGEDWFRAELMFKANLDQKCNT
jgi:N-acylneuraminate cytidylyltransferase